ncbi:MAG: hypothetical protein VX527_04570 [Planctomycetota bacterium]|nr:hypothetical protein [Planctomycetota bacterium]
MHDIHMEQTTEEFFMCWCAVAIHIERWRVHCNTMQPNSLLAYKPTGWAAYEGHDPADTLELHSNPFSGNVLAGLSSPF